MLFLHDTVLERTDTYSSVMIMAVLNSFFFLMTTIALSLYTVNDHFNAFLFLFLKEYHPVITYFIFVSMF